MDQILAALAQAVPSEVKNISRVLAEAGHRSWLVGGSVRDIVSATLRGRTIASRGDFDLATDAHPREVTKLFRKVIPTGIEHGTVTVVLKQQHFEITTLRGERGHSDGRRPDEVFFVDDLKEDLARRDFTVNAMAYSVEDKTFHDPFLGLKDLESGLLRAVGEPSARFLEDGLRVLRCARFSATLGLDIEPSTARAIRPSLASFEKVAQERVRDEWFKALGSNAPSRFLLAIREHGLLSITCPDLFPDHPAAPASMDFLTTLERIDSAPKDALLRLALFLYAGTSGSDANGAPTPEQAEARARSLAQRLRLSREQGGHLMLLCRYAELPPDLLASCSPPQARSWLSSVGRERVEDTLVMQVLARQQSLPKELLEERHQLLRAELASSCALSLKELKVSGGDLMAAGVPRGPLLGKVLARLLEIVLKDPEKNTPEALLLTAKEISASLETDP